MIGSVWIPVRLAFRAARHSGSVYDPLVGYGKFPDVGSIPATHFMQHYVTGIIAAPRPENYISNTLESYFDEFTIKPHVFHEPGFHPYLHHSRVFDHHNEKKLGCVHNWLNAVEWLLANTESAYVMMLEDDIQFQPLAGLWLKTNFDCSSAYCAEYNRPRTGLFGWQETHYGQVGLCGSLALLFRRSVLEDIYINRTYFVDAASNFGKIKKTLHLDFAVGATLKHLGYTIMTHNPTLVLHTGEISTYENNNTETGKTNKYRMPAL